MHLDRPTLDQRLAGLASLGLLTEREASDVRMTLAPEFAFRAAMTHAESVHLHIRVDDVERTRAALARLVGTPENEKSGYVKYRSPDGLHVIVWSIDVAEDDRISSLRRRARPHLDHLGMGGGTRRASAR